MDEIEKAEQEIVYWAILSMKDLKFYVGLSEAIEKRNKFILKLIVEIRYGSE